MRPRKPSPIACSLARESGFRNVHCGDDRSNDIAIWLVGSGTRGANRTIIGDPSLAPATITTRHLHRQAEPQAEERALPSCCSHEAVDVVLDPHRGRSQGRDDPPPGSWPVRPGRRGSRSLQAPAGAGAACSGQASGRASTNTCRRATARPARRARCSCSSTDTARTATGRAEAYRTSSSPGIPKYIDVGGWPTDRPFVVLAPQHVEEPPASTSRSCDGVPWGGSCDMQLQHDRGNAQPAFCTTPDEVHDFIAYAVAHYNVDPARVYLTGLSCGAFGVWEYLAKYGATARSRPRSRSPATDGPARGGLCALGRRRSGRFTARSTTRRPARQHRADDRASDGCPGVPADGRS